MDQPVEVRQTQALKNLLWQHRLADAGYAAIGECIANSPLSRVAIVLALQDFLPRLSATVQAERALLDELVDCLQGGRR